MMRYVRSFAVMAALALLLCAVTACAGEGRTVTYAEQEHICAFGHWSDAAPANEGEPVTHEVRYCKVCHKEELRVRE